MRPAAIARDAGAAPGPESRRPRRGRPEPRGAAEGDAPQVQSIARALDVLEALAGHESVGLVEIGRVCGLQPSTTHRILRTLRARGYVRQDAQTFRYALTDWITIRPGRTELAPAELRTAALPFLERIMRVGGETANLAVLDGADAVYIDRVPDGRSDRGPAEPLRRVRAHATSAGKAILAFMDPDAVRELLPQRLSGMTERTTSDRDELLTELEAIRRQGFATDREEHLEKMSCVGAPVFDALGDVVAALSMSGPSNRLGPLSDYDEIGELVGVSAIEMSRVLGYTGDCAWDGRR